MKLEEELWHQILNAIAEAKDPIPIFQSLLSAAEKRDLSDRLRPSGDELDEMCDRLLSDALTNAADTPLDLVKRLLKTSGKYLSIYD